MWHCFPGVIGFYWQGYNIGLSKIKEEEDLRGHLAGKISEFTELFKKPGERGFSYITLDLGGYRTGSMNETLQQEELDDGMGN